MKLAVIGLLVAALAASCGNPVQASLRRRHRLLPTPFASGSRYCPLMNSRAARLFPQASTKLLNIFPHDSKTRVCGLEETMVRIFRMSGWNSFSP